MKYNFKKISHLPFRAILRIYAVAATIMLALLILFQYKAKMARDSFYAAVELESAVEQLSNTFPEFINTKRTENFYLYGYDEETEKIQTEIQQLYTIILTENSTDAFTTADEAGNAKQLKFLAENFHKSFERFTDAEKTIGNNDFGVIQSLNDAGDFLMLHPEIWPDSAFRQKTIQLIGLARKYTAQPNKKNKDRFLQLSEELISLAKPAKGISASEQQKELTAALVKYRTRFIALSDAYTRLGTNKQEGLISDAFAALDELMQISTSFFNFQSEHFKNYSDKVRSVSYLLFGLLILIPAILGWWLFSNMKKRFEHIDILLQYLKEGEIERFDYPQDIEVLPLIKTIEKIFIGLKNKNRHIRNIASGRLNKSKERYALHDVLGQTIIKLEESVLQSQKEKEDELKKKESEDRRIRGLAKFAGIMRENAGRPQKLAQAVISELVNFLSVELGGFYILDSEKDPPEYELAAAYAYDKAKLMDKRAKHGIGLIGTAASDKVSFYYDELPEDYLTIITGFGQAPPKTLLVQPLISGETVVGVLELASIRDFQPNDIEFVKSLADDIASALRYIVLEKETL